jgi:hypothetical protein
MSTVSFPPSQTIAVSLPHRHPDINIGPPLPEMTVSSCPCLVPNMQASTSSGHFMSINKAVRIDNVVPAPVPVPGQNSPAGSTTSADSRCGTADHITTIMAGPIRIVHVHFGSWKCEVCNQVFRRKQRAAIHYWNKHGNLRLSCKGACGNFHW